MDTKNPIHLTYVATLPCETLMLAKQAINDKLQASVVFIQIIVKKLNSLKHLVRTTVAQSHN